MKYIKTYENIYNLNIHDLKQYYIIKNINTNEINVAWIYNSNQYDNRYLAENILPINSKTYYIYSDEIAENTYQDEYYNQIEILYTTKDYDDIKNKFNIYTTANKYNL